MPHLRLLAALATLVLVAAPVAADPGERGTQRSYDQGEKVEKKNWSRSARYDKRSKRWRYAQRSKRWRYAQRRNYYAYPWTPWWGPFPGPPGL